MAIPTRLDGTRVIGAANAARFAGTAVAPMPPPLRRPKDDEKSWEAVLARIDTWRSEHIDEDAMAVVVRAPDGTFTTSLASSSSDPVALIVGRHERCDVLLPEDAAGSLRQAAVVLWPGTHEGKPARVAVVDLRTSTGLRINRGGKLVIARRLSSTSALHFAAGAADVYVVVAGRDKPMPARFADELDAQLSGVLVDDADVAPERQRSEWTRSAVLSAGSIRALPRDGLVVRATADEVARGIVLGRYERCHRTNAMAERAEISRVHALLFVKDGALWLVDTGSTAGTTVVVDRTRAHVELGEGRRITKLDPSARIVLADVEVAVDVVGGVVGGVGAVVAHTASTSSPGG